MPETPATPTPDPGHAYVARRTERQAAHAAADERHRRIGTLRLGALGLAGALGLGIIGGAAYSGWWLLVPLGIVVALGIQLDRVEAERIRLARAIAFYDRGLARLDDAWAGGGNTGARFAESAARHLYAADLDLFGRGSMFERLCGARTRMGEATLAGWLLAPADPAVVGRRQRAVDELSDRLDLREDLAVLGDDADAGVRAEALVAWGEAPLRMRAGALVVAARLGTVAGAVALGAGVIYALAAGRSLALEAGTLTLLRWYIIGAALGVTAVNLRVRAAAEQVLTRVSAAADDVALLASILGRLETERFEAPHLATLRAALDVEGEPPSRRVARLARLVEQVDSRRNAFARLFGFVLVWDAHLARAAERWRLACGPTLRTWLDAVGEIEALASLAGYRYERPDDVWPTVEPGPPRFDADALAHPLLARTAVANDVRLDAAPQLLVVSGSNMSGKSTLLRTIGLNAVLAQAGAPVRASRLVLSPLAVGASIRVTDSLQDGSSRFYAEILRLRALVDAAGGPTPLLFLIDECLHGTNSHDRRIGAAAVVRGLVDRGALGLVTTHDLALTAITETLGTRAANVHFSDHLEDGRLRFDFTMRPGVVRKSNAIDLMRSIGLQV